MPLLKLLLEHGAIVDARDKMLRTPLTVALAAERPEAANFLLNYRFLGMPWPKFYQYEYDRCLANFRIRSSEAGGKLDCLSSCLL